MRFEFHRSEYNCHGTQKAGEPWNKETVRGPRFKWLKLERKSPGFSRRLIFYFPSGSWWHLDIYSRLQASASTLGTKEKS